MNFESTNNEGLAQMFQAFAAMPTLVALVQEQREQISAIRAELRGLKNNQSPASDLPEGYIDPKILAVVKYVTIKQAAFLLQMSAKSVRRKIQDGQLATSKGLRVKRIPVEAIEAYKAKTLSEPSDILSAISSLNSGRK